MIDDRAGVGQFDDAAEVHHRDAVTDMPHRSKVMGNKDQCELQPLAQICQQIDDLGLDRDIKRADRLVGDNQLGPEGKRPGDANPLPLAAGKLMRIAAARPSIHADRFQQLLNPLPSLAARGQAEVSQRFGQDRLDGHSWIERGKRILKDHLHALPQFPQPAIPPPAAAPPLPKRVDRLAVKHHAAGRRPQQLENCPAGGRFPTAALADQAKGLSTVHGKADTIDRPNLVETLTEPAP